jgi:integrase
MGLGKSQGFSLFRYPLRNGVSVWYARYWDQTTQRYAKTLSTGVVVTHKELMKIIKIDEADKRSYLGILLGVLCGMRRGEVRRLLWGDGLK